MHEEDDDWSFRPSKPRAVRGGIKSRSQHGAFGQSWWAKRWIAMLGQFNLEARLARGRSYARSGQVLSITIDSGRVSARVQGSVSTPYNVTIEVTPLSEQQWDTLAHALSRQAIFAARLLAGEMPNDIEDVFRDTRIPLFPEQAHDLRTECTCPDWSNPCKHIAAVYYLLGEEFDRDPFLIFKLRGMEREQLMAKLARDADVAKQAPQEQQELPPEELRTNPGAFWGNASYADAETAELRIPPVAAALLRQLGPFPFWRANEPLEGTLEPLYASASLYALGSILADTPTGSRAATGDE